MAKLRQLVIIKTIILSATILQCCFYVLNSYTALGESIQYTVKNKLDDAHISFKIIGKTNNRIFIYKNDKNKWGHISSYNDNMLFERNYILPKHIKKYELIGTNITLNGTIQLFIQYEHKKQEFIALFTIDTSNTLLHESMKLDSLPIDEFDQQRFEYKVKISNNKTYTVLYRVGSIRNNRLPIVIQFYDTALHTLARRYFNLELQKQEECSDFQLSDDGCLYALEGLVQGNKNDNLKILKVSKDTSKPISLFICDDSLYYNHFPKFQLDLANNRIVIAYYYSTTRLGHIEGINCMLWDNNGDSIIQANRFIFSANDQQQATTSGGAFKKAFDEFQVEHIIFRKNGSFILAGEGLYEQTRQVYLNNNAGYLNGNSYLGGNSWSGIYSPYGASSFGGRNYAPSETVTKYFAENICLISVDSTLEKEWINFINKDQWENKTDRYISYQLLPVYKYLYCFFNRQNQEHYTPTDYLIDDLGNMQYINLFNRLNHQYTYSMRNSYAISPYEIIIPFTEHEQLGFAKINLIN
ncbi:MAG: hypothetical protein QM528_07275 [Phycisphaerales bacterium]|nr:hypothetical protein [Phycisphaerales bacterium]